MIKRLTKEGMKNSPFYYERPYQMFINPELQLPNCVAYACGRSSEIANKGLVPSFETSEIPNTNACTWYSRSKWQKGSVPKLGAIACWDGTLGHVAIVEDILDNGNVLVSQSNYDTNKSYDNPKYFETKIYNPVVGKVTSGVGLKFQGYLYNPYVEDNMELIKITKEKGYEYKWSVDGNPYGDMYQITTMGGFGDETLKKDGWEEVLATNGGLFYQYGMNYYACGLEKSRGKNNQELEMSAVTDYNNAMAIACVNDELWYASQSWIIKNKLNEAYGAITGLGLLLNGVKVNMHEGFNSQWNQISGRTVIGEDKDGNIMSYSFAGVTGQSGMTCGQLQTKCLELGFHNAICFDGGGSVWRRVNGKNDITTTRKVKNALLLYRRKIEEKKEEPTDNTSQLEAQIKALTDELANTKEELKSTADKLVFSLDKLEKIKEIINE